MYSNDSTCGGMDMRNKQLIPGFVILIFLILMINGCVHADGALKGKVLDVETKEPLEGTVILAVWERVYLTPFGENSYFYDAKEALTNKGGEFEIPSYFTINLLPFISYIDGPVFTVFKPGYGSLSRINLVKYISGETAKAEDMKLSGKIYRLAPGVIELPRLSSWVERNKENMISPYGDIPKNKWPLLNKSIDEEEKWLKNNKDWRR